MVNRGYKKAKCINHWIEVFPEFLVFIDWLERYNYKLTINEYDSYTSIKFEDGHIIGFVDTPAWDSCTNGFIYADSRKAFNKLSQCPLICKVPRTDRDFEEFNKYLRFLSTKEGVEYSNELQFYYNERIPRDQR